MISELAGKPGKKAKPYFKSEKKGKHGQKEYHEIAIRTPPAHPPTADTQRTLGQKVK